MNHLQNKSEQSPRLTFVGGFLGAGKTTALTRLGSLLKQTAVTVGVITTTSGGSSVDTIRLKHSGLAVEELAGGYLQANTVAEAALRLGTRQVLVEVPGSSTGTRPVMERLQESGFELAPLTVMVEPRRAGRMLGLDGKSRFSEAVAYLYRKQIEEADLVLVNERVLSSRELNSALEREYSDAAILSLRDNLDPWADCLKRPFVRRSLPAELDQDRYARAVSLLAAISAAVKFSTVKYFDGNRMLLELAGLVQSLLQQEAVEIAHLKIAMSSDSGELASAHATSSDAVPELENQQSEPIQLGRMVLNLHAEGDPELLHSAVNRAIMATVEKSTELFARMEEARYYRPEAPPRNDSILNPA